MSPTIDICICTFRRPDLAATLRSLAAMDLPLGYRVGIIVADNDDVPSAAELVDQHAVFSEVPIRYIHAPARNISIARNACLDASDADFIAFIDDDEKATNQWLPRLTEMAAMSGADVVLGPVRARYSTSAPDWMRMGDFHSTFPVFVKGEIRTGYTCNVLLKMTVPAIAGLRFNLARGRTGGEDSEFFDQVFGAGGRFAYAADAWVEEPVPASRASFRWLARRRYRVGQTHGRLSAAKRSVFGLVPAVGLATAKAGYSFGSAALAAFSPVRRNRGLLRGVMHLGAVSGLIGMRELRLYGGREVGNAA